MNWYYLNTISVKCLMVAFVALTGCAEPGSDGLSTGILNFSEGDNVSLDTVCTMSSGSSQDLLNCIGAVSKPGGTVVINGEVIIDESAEIPPGVLIQFGSSGKFTISSGRTLTINGPIHAGLTHIFDGEGIVTGSLLTDTIYPQWFGAVTNNNTPDDQAINKAIALAGTSRVRAVSMPAGRYEIDNPITMMTAGVNLKGAGFSSGNEDGRTMISKRGNFDAIQIQAHSITIESIDVFGNEAAGDGISVEGARNVLRDVSSRNHGGNGIRLGKNGSSTNLWRMYNVLSISNGESGIYIHDEMPPIDVNAGIASGLDLRANTLDGLRLGNCYDNQFHGATVQNNVGVGINIGEQANGNSFFAPYLEANNSGNGLIAEGAKDNMILGTRQGVSDGWTVDSDNDNDNLILGRQQSVNDMFMFRGNVAHDNLHIGNNNPQQSGLWRLHKDADNRDLLIELSYTGADADVVIIHSDPTKATDLVIPNGSVVVNGIALAPTAANQVGSNTVFIDERDGRLKFRDSGNNVRAIPTED